MRLRTAMDIGAAIRQKRKTLGLDQGSVSERVGVSRQWVVDIEKGKPRAALRLVLRTLEVLGIELWTEESEPASVRGALPGAGIDLGRVLEAHRGPGKRVR
ncbi:MAG: type II toxin-antitoxin system Y4mF family antitoxin [Dehalococcoidia bacterium]